MKNPASLAHALWECNYHVEFTVAPTGPSDTWLAPLCGAGQSHGF